MKPSAGPFAKADSLAICPDYCALPQPTPPWSYRPMDMLISTMGPVLLIGLVGWIALHYRLLPDGSIGVMTNLVFNLLTPALLFRTMSSIGLSGLQMLPVAAYFGTILAIFAAVVLVSRILLKRSGRAGYQAAVLGIAATFSNMVMIGIPLISLAFGPKGLFVLLMLISLHALILLSVTTLALEWMLAHDTMQTAMQDGTDVRLPGWRDHLTTLGKAAKNTLIHPVPLPIIAGLLYSATGWGIPKPIDTALQIMGQANGPISLLLVGATLSGNSLRGVWQTVAGLVVIKNLLQPCAVALVCWLLGIRGLTLAVLTVTAAMPIGANAFLFSRRYQTAEAEVTAAIAASTMIGMVTIGIALVAADWLRTLPP